MASSFNASIIENSWVSLGERELRSRRHLDVARKGANLCRYWFAWNRTAIGAGLLSEGWHRLLAVNNCLDFADRLLYVVIDDLVLVLIGGRQLPPGDFQSPLDGGFRFAVPSPQPRFQHLPGWR